MSEHAKFLDRLAFVELTPEKLEKLGKLNKHITRHIGPALDRLYEQIEAFPAAAGFFENRDRMAYAKGRQFQHWQAIASGQLDAKYLESAQRIGHVHARIGLEPRWYIGGYALVMEELVKGVLKEAVDDHFQQQRGWMKRRFTREEVVEGVADVAGDLCTLLKAILIDSDIAISTYIEKNAQEAQAINQQITQVVALAQNGDFAGRINYETRTQEFRSLTGGINNLMNAVEQATKAIAKALSGLARADLTAHMEGQFSGIFAQLQRDMTSVGANLSEVIARVRDGSQELRQVTASIMGDARALSDRTDSQAAAVTQTSTAVSQLAGTVKENAARSEAVRDKAKELSHTAAQVGDVISRADAAMGEISSSSDKISSIITLIDDIAFQTNLLALNAAVEAARAGDAGKGFAVVATEVRRLAQSAAQASGDIKTLITQSRREVTDGFSLVSQASRDVHAMRESIQQSNTLLEDVANVMREQASMISEIAQAINHIDDLTRNNVIMVDETSVAIERVEAQAANLERAANVFTVGLQKPQHERRNAA